MRKMDHQPISNQQASNSIRRSKQDSNSIRPQQDSNSIRRPKQASNSIRPQQDSNSIRRPKQASNSIRPQQASNSIRRPKQDSNSIRPQQASNSIRPQQDSNSIHRPKQASKSIRRPKQASNESERVSICPTPIEFVNCYSSHKDKVEEVKRFNKPFLCNGCKESGFKSRYRCEPCNFDLHPECIFAKRTISPEIFHEELVFEFRPEGPQPPKEKICDACGEKLCDACGEKIHGCFYNCRAKGMDLHPCCARLKAQVRNHDTVLVLCKKASSECLRCRKKESPAPGTKWGTPGWCYVSECKEYNIHIFCITEMFHQAWKEGLMDHTGGNSISNINLDHMALSHGNRGGRGTKALKIIGILRIVFGIFAGDPSALIGKLMLEILEQLQ